MRGIRFQKKKNCSGLLVFSRAVYLKYLFGQKHCALSAGCIFLRRVSSTANQNADSAQGGSGGCEVPEGGAS